MDNKIILGVDIGGSHITSALINIEKGIVVENSLFRKAVDSGGTLEEIIDIWCTAMVQSLSTQQIQEKYIGIAMPGPFNYSAGISFIKEQAKYKALYGFNLKDLLAKKIGIHQKNIHFENDACCFLLGECFAGAVQNQQHLLGLTLGTGLGSAIYNSGAVKDAELWKSPFKLGIAEDYLSTKWFVNKYYEQHGEELAGVKEILTVAKYTTFVKELFEEFGTNLAAFIAEITVTNQFNEVVMGGNITKAADYFLPSANLYLKKMELDIKINIGSLGENAAMIGAAGNFKQIS